MATRPAGKAGKAGSWYEVDPAKLKRQLYDYIAKVPDRVNDSTLPIPGARIVIAPHAGYDFSGACAAWAYKSLDLRKAKRVFVLGPSHTYGFTGSAATTFEKYATPLGDLVIDRATVKQVKDAAEMEDMPRENEIREHSLEMHMPYLYLRLEQTFGSEERFPPIVPILVGSNNGKGEKKIGLALLPFLKDSENAFIISSDFCHWGKDFNYLPYSPTHGITDLTNLNPRGRKPSGPPIHETIRAVDEDAMNAVKSGSHDAFLASLRKTGNTVCGRHPIGVIMAALELLRKESEYESMGFFHIVRYDRSSFVQYPIDSSVSYVSAYAVV